MSTDCLGQIQPLLTHTALQYYRYQSTRHKFEIRSTQIDVTLLNSMKISNIVLFLCKNFMSNHIHGLHCIFLLSNEIFLNIFNPSSVLFWQLLPFPHRRACLHHTGHRTSRKRRNGWCYSVARRHNWQWCWLSGETPFDISPTQSWCKLPTLQAERAPFVWESNSFS